jgi:hypothetical protein
MGVGDAGVGRGQAGSWAETESPPTPRPGRMVIGLWAGHHGHVHDGVGNWHLAASAQSQDAYQVMDRDHNNSCVILGRRS